MKRPRRVFHRFHLVAWFALLALTAACGKGGGGGGDPAAGPTLESLSVQPQPVVLTAAGETVQLAVTGHFSDGTTQDLTGNTSGTTCRSSQPGLVAVTADGALKALASGEATLTFSCGGVSARVPVRVSIPAPPPVPAAVATAEELRTRLGDGLSVRWSAKTGLPRALLNRNGYLSAPSDLEPLENFEAFLTANRAIYGISPESLAEDYAVASSYTSTHNGVAHVVLEQFHEDIPVFGARLQANINRNGRVMNVVGDHYTGVDAPTVPGLGAVRALTLAVETVEPSSQYQPRVASGPEGPTHRTVFEQGPWADRPTASLTVYPAAGRFHLAWQIVFPRNPLEVYLVVLDAATGETLYHVNTVIIG